MRWQLEEMNGKGIAGTWYYPRFTSGEPLASDPPFWTEEWWDFVRFSMEEHRRLGMAAWLNDWTARQFFQDRLRAEREGKSLPGGRRLALHSEESQAPGAIEIAVPPGEEVLDAAAYRMAGGGLDHASREDLGDAVRDRRLTWKADEAGWVAAVVTAQPHDLDYLHPSTADRWLELLAGTCEEKLGEYVGTTLKACGTDEMLVLNGNLFYSRSLFDRFVAEKGYDPAPFLVGLFRDIGATTDRIRCDYHEVLSAMVEENLYARLSRGLQERGMLFTEFCPNGKSEDMLAQTYHYGDFFRYMSNYTIPGNEENSGRTRTFQAKMASSIANLYGRNRVGVCAYWGSGWGHTTGENLAWTHENYALGVNLYNRHGVLHNSLGGWYEWVPPAVHFRQPYWQYWKRFTDYVTRLSFILSQGTHRADVALLYPLTTVRAHWSGGRPSVEGTRRKFDDPGAFGAAAHEAAAAAYRAAKRIYRSGIDLDFIDDRSLCRGEVKEGELIAAGMAFRAVVLPPMTTIGTETLERIRAFHDSGGVVAAFGRLPHASPEGGRNDPHIQALLGGIFGVKSSDGVAGPVQRENEKGGKAFFLPDGDASIPEVLSGAIPRDVRVPEGEVFHTHRTIGDLEVYFLFNARAESRDISLHLRAAGEPEIWDAFTGETAPHHRFEIREDGTRVRLEMEPCGGTLLVLAPPRGRPQVLEDDLTAVTSVESRGKSLRVRGFCAAGGKKKVRLLHEEEDGLRMRKSTNRKRLCPWTDRGTSAWSPPWTTGGGTSGTRPPRSGSAPRPGGSATWKSRNRGASGRVGTKREFDDSRWEQVTCTYGPYWWTIGPFEGGEPQELLDRARAGRIAADEPCEVEGRSFRWRKYGFSRQFGHEGKEAHNRVGGGLRGVSEDFLLFDTASEERDAARYLFTSVHSPREEEYVLNFGGTAEFARDAWVNGTRSVSVSSRKAEAQAAVRLKEGWNSVLLRLVQPKGEQLATFAVLHRPGEEPPCDPCVPLLRWFSRPQELLFDVTPGKARRVGWYRFTAPPGLEAMTLNLKAEAVAAWIDGQPAAVEQDRIVLETPKKETCRIALRVEQEAGRYAGAAFESPVAFTCTQGRIPLGDWCGHGLATYSGGAVYGRRVKLEKRHLRGKVLLDLGEVAAAAEVHVNGQPAGVGMAGPWRFDVTRLVAEGENRIEVKVVNTLANHMSTYPTRYVYEGQTVSGLLGPVTIQFLAKAAFTI